MRLDPARRRPKPEEMLTLPPENRPLAEAVPTEALSTGEAATIIDENGRTIPLPPRPPAARDLRET